MKNRLLILSIVLGCSVSIANAQQTANPNLALGKKFVSSDPGSKDWNRGLTDGDWVPTQSSTFGTGKADAFPKTVTLDLETAQTLGYVAMGVPPFGSTKTVSVSLSADGVTFSEVGRTVFAAGAEQKHVFDFAATSARFVRLTYLDYYTEKKDSEPTQAFTTELAVYAPGAAPVLPPTPTLPEPADVAAPKRAIDGTINENFLKMHESFLQRAKEGPIGVLFVGDSITDFWRRDNAKESWARWSRYNPANFGIRGDKTQHILWRFEQGELNGINPKVVVVMIGTNNMAQNSADEIAKGDAKIVAEIHRRLPDAKVLLLGIFPRGFEATNPLRAKIKAVNAQLAALDDGAKTRFLDFGDKFLEADGSISKKIMPDGTHPSPQGYNIWVDAMSPLLDEMMK